MSHSSAVPKGAILSANSMSSFSFTNTFLQLFDKGQKRGITLAFVAVIMQNAAEKTAAVLIGRIELSDDGGVQIARRFFTDRASGNNGVVLALVEGRFLSVDDGWSTKCLSLSLKDGAAERISRISSPPMPAITTSSTSSADTSFSPSDKRVCIFFDNPNLVIFSSADRRGRGLMSQASAEGILPLLHSSIGR